MFCHTCQHTRTDRRHLHRTLQRVPSDSFTCRPRAPAIYLTCTRIVSGAVSVTVTGVPAGRLTSSPFVASTVAVPAPPPIAAPVAAPLPPPTIPPMMAPAPAPIPILVASFPFVELAS